VLSGTGTITASVVTNAGAIAPGNSIGRLAVNANLRLQPSCNCTFSWALRGGSGYDVVAVSNAVTLPARSASVLPMASNAVTNGATFTVLTASSSRAHSQTPPMARSLSPLTASPASASTTQPPR